MHYSPTAGAQSCVLLSPSFQDGASVFRTKNEPRVSMAYIVSSATKTVSGSVGMSNESLEFSALVVQIWCLNFGRMKTQHGSAKLDGLRVDSGTIRGGSEIGSPPGGQAESNATVRRPRCAMNNELMCVAYTKYTSHPRSHE